MSSALILSFIGAQFGENDYSPTVHNELSSCSGSASATIFGVSRAQLRLNDFDTWLPWTHRQVHVTAEARDEWLDPSCSLSIVNDVNEAPVTSFTNESYGGFHLEREDFSLQLDDALVACTRQLGHGLPVHFREEPKPWHDIDPVASRLLDVVDPRGSICRPSVGYLYRIPELDLEFVERYSWAGEMSLSSKSDNENQSLEPTNQAWSTRNAGNSYQT